MTPTGSPVTPRNPWRWVPSAWFSMGLVYALATNISALLLRDSGMSTAGAIACASALGLPYIVKPLYAPIIELHRTKRFFVLLSQWLLVFALLGASMLLFWHARPILIVAMLGFVAFVGSVQDIACEGTYLSALDRRRQGVFSGLQSIFWNGAALIGGGILIFISGIGQHGWAAALCLCAIVYALASIWHRSWLPGSAPLDNSGSRPRKALSAALTSFFERPGLWPSIALCLGFPISAGLIEKLEIFFLVDPAPAGGLGIAREAVAAFYTLAGFGGLVTGATLGSIALHRGTLARLMLPMALSASAPGLIYLLLALPATMPPLLVAIAFFAARALLAFGMIGYVVFLQRALSPGSFPTTHYNLASGLKALTMTLAGAASGPLQHIMGYRGLFVLALTCSIPTLWICRPGTITRFAPES